MDYSVRRSPAEMPEGFLVTIRGWNEEDVGSGDASVIPDESTELVGRSEAE